MSAQNTGGPAFPGIEPYVNHPTHGRIHRAQLGEEIASGMNLRDYMAIHARVEAFSLDDAVRLLGRQCPDWRTDSIGNMTFWADAEAAIRYLKADAMLRARGA